MKREYESPKFDFEELKLFERVADVCWGTAQIWLDTNGDGAISGVDINLTTGGGCQGNWSAGALTDAIDQFNSLANQYNSTGNPDVFAASNPELAQYLRENPGVLKLIEAEPQSNWANTKQISGGGIIIDKS